MIVCDTQANSDRDKVKVFVKLETPIDAKALHCFIDRWFTYQIVC
jgi:hypothetical protein